MLNNILKGAKDKIKNGMDEKNILKGAKDKIKSGMDEIATQQIKESLITAIEKNEVSIKKLITPEVDLRLDALIKSLISEHGYVKLAKFGINTTLK